MFIVLLWIVRLLHLCNTSDIKTSYQNVSVVNGETVLLNCTCFGQDGSKWLGPPKNYTTDKSLVIAYSNGLRLNPKLIYSNVLVIGSYDNGKCSLEVRSFSDNDVGNYTCSYNVNGSVNTDVYYVFTKRKSSLYKHVQGPQVVEIRYHYTEHYIHLKCIPSGLSENYTFITWEHQSEYKEHIRYLNGQGKGKVKIKREIATSKRYQDNGFYICRVWNGMPGVNESLLQEGYKYIAIGDAPEFMTDNQMVQYGTLGKEGNITVKIYSNPAPTNATIQRNNRKKRFWAAVSNQTRKKFYLLHKSYVSIPVIQLTFRIKLNTTEDFDAYTITVCNIYGCSDFAFEIQSTGKLDRLVDIEWLSLPLLLLICLAITIVVSKRNRKKPGDVNDTGNGRQNEDIADAEQISVVVDNRLYRSTEVLNVRAVGEIDGAMSFDTSGLPSPILDDNDNACFNPLYCKNMVPTAEKHTGHKVGFKMSSERLNYSEIVFEPRHSSRTSVIHGIEDRTIYSDIDLSLRAVLAESTSGSDTDDDFVCLEEIQPLNAYMKEL